MQVDRTIIALVRVIMENAWQGDRGGPLQARMRQRARSVSRAALPANGSHIVHETGKALNLRGPCIKCQSLLLGVLVPLINRRQTSAGATHVVQHGLGHI